MNHGTARTDQIRSRFEAEGVRVVSVTERAFPGEIIFIVEVRDHYDEAIALASKIDCEIEGGFITVRKATESAPSTARRVSGVRDEQITGLIELMDARSRTSEAQPSLNYVADVAGRLAAARARRHHVVFGRRGVGKTALLLEAKRLIEAAGEQALWLNLQSLRGLDTSATFLTFASRLCDLMIANFLGFPAPPASLNIAKDLRGECARLLGSASLSLARVLPMVPQLQQLVRQYCEETQLALFLFFDDAHYISRSELPQFLDMVHGVTRDNPVFIKAAGIKHQMRWFVVDPPTGLQIGHDATSIDLDVTLQEPDKAKTFLLSILDAYIAHVRATPRSAFLSAEAIDRLVLASGGVPRDFMLLCAASIKQARERLNARAAGVQDVNNAAGQAAATKLRELEDDAASERESARTLLASLDYVRSFLLTERQVTFMRVDFTDKEHFPREYGLLQSLMDLRMLHLVHSSISDEHQAGRRFEVYVLDLSQYSGARFKQNLLVLDFQNTSLVLKRTRSKVEPRIGNTPNALLGLLRRGPVLELAPLAARLEGLDRTR